MNASMRTYKVQLIECEKNKQDFKRGQQPAVYVFATQENTTTLHFGDVKKYLEYSLVYSGPLVYEVHVLPLYVPI